MVNHKHGVSSIKICNIISFNCILYIRIMFVFAITGLYNFYYITSNVKRALKIGCGSLKQEGILLSFLYCYMYYLFIIPYSLYYMMKLWALWSDGLPPGNSELGMKVIKTLIVLLLFFVIFDSFMNWRGSFSIEKELNISARVTGKCILFIN